MSIRIESKLRFCCWIEVQSGSPEKEKEFFLGFLLSSVKNCYMEVLFKVLTKLGHKEILIFAHERRSAKNIML